MKILQILPELNVGGVETGTLDLAKHLVKLGHKAVVVSNGGELVRELEESGAIHYQLPVHKKSIFNIFKMISRIEQIIWKEEIDIVHVRSRVPAWIAYFACRRTRKIFISTCHGYYQRHPFSYPMAWAKRVIVLSNVIARHMIDDFSVPHERIRLIARSVDLERFKYISPDAKRKEEFNVGIIGRITPLKGHLHFVKAMAKVARSVPHLKVWIVGDSPHSKADYKEQVQVLVRRLGLWHATEFLGVQRDIPAIMAHLDVLVLATTTQEAFGRVIVEAQASGVPVVATQVGGVVDIIEDNKTGLLVPPCDPRAMAEAVIRIFQDAKFAAGLAEQAYKKVQEKYNVELMVRKTIDVYEEAARNFRLLIIKFSSLGDLILSTAAIKAIRQHFKQGYKISMITDESCRDLLLNCPYIDELIVCDLKGKDKGLRGLLKVARKIRKRNFDLVIDLQNNRNSHILSALSLALDRYGYNNKKFGFLLNHTLREDKAPIGPVEHQFRVLKLLGIEAREPRLELWPTQADQDYVDGLLANQWLSPNQKLVGLNISASQRWQSKNWPLENIAKLCDELSRKELRVVLTGTENDAAAVEKLINLAKEAKLINACGKTTINQLACLIRRCSVYISSDSAPLHLAASQDVPLVAIFGPTDFRRHMPPAKKYIILRKELKCSPCYKPECKTVKCLKQIKPEEVLDAVEKLLK